VEEAGAHHSGSGGVADPSELLRSFLRICDDFFMPCRLLFRHTEAEQFSKRSLGQPGPSTESEPGLKEEVVGMNLYTWLPAMFILGLVMMGLCLLFVEACDKM
jgi:hypothetical protein